MSKIKFIVISIVAALAIGLAQRTASADAHEPDFDGGESDRYVASASQESALAQNGLDQIGHGILVLAVVAALALKRR